MTEVLKLTLASLAARKIRLALTTFAVVLGVAFVSGSFILADSLRGTFDEIAQEIAGPGWVQVRGVETIDGDEFSRPLVPEELIDELLKINGVDSAVGNIQGFPRLSFNGELIDSGRAPTLAFNSTPGSELTAFITMEGADPGPGEAMLDVDSAARYGVSVGDKITVRSQSEPEQFIVSGITSWGEDNGGGAVFVLFDTATTQRLFGYDKTFMSATIGISAGFAAESVIADLNPLLNELELEAVTSETVATEFSAEFDQFITIFQNALLAFAAISLIVSAFIINNTFSIVLGQRIKELGLLRSLGATGKQVQTSVILEGLIIGLIASLIGLFSGVGIAALLKILIAQAGDGAGLPDGPLVIAGRTWIAAFIVGLVVTLTACLSPARKAATIPPIAALRDDFSLSSKTTNRRSIFGGLIGLAGVLLIVRGVTSNSGARGQLLALSLGALLTFLSIALLSQLVASPMAKFLGWPFAQLAPASGVLARENAARNPRRTSSTASALMIGLALVAMVLVVGTSFKKTFSAALDTSLKADYFVDLKQESFIGFSPKLAQDLQNIEGIETAVGFRGGGRDSVKIRVNNASKDVTATEEAGLGLIVDLSLSEGSYSGLNEAGVLVHRDPATDLDLSIGDSITAIFPVSGSQTLTVVGIYEDSGILGNWVIGTNTFESGFDPALQFDNFVAAKLSKGFNAEDLKQQIGTITAAYPEARIQTKSEFQKTTENRINQLLVAVNALVGFAVVIAMLGIVNTLVLSVFERTREIGLLRAVGMTRRQTRRMIRWEAIIVSVFGGVLGISLGVVLGFVAVQAMPDSFVTDFGVPYGNFFSILILCTLGGAIAAIIPARRAAKLNILDAIGHV
ncbi:MAG: ABC transporter permease [Actinomycetota bacterium]|nr:FtsX-like permease family protein [Acidimicrobiales bacterium]